MSSFWRWLAGLPELVMSRMTRTAAELVLVTVSAALVAATALIGDISDKQPAMGVGGVALLATGIAALPFRHRYPAAVMGVVFATTLTYISLGYTKGPIWLPMIAAFTTLVLTGRRRLAIATLVAGFVGFTWLGYAIGRAEPPSIAGVVALSAWLITLISVAEAVRYRRERAAEEARSQAEATRRQVTDERLRIARELHDVVAHNMSLISLQAGVALHLLDTKPEEVRASLGTIKDASKEALVELRSILGVLRLVDEEAEGSDAEAATSASGSAPRTPVPSLGRLDGLVDRARAAGLEVAVEVDPDVGDLAELPRQVDLAAFRIVQESLTNVARHSDDPRATVRLGTRNGGLTIDVLDEGSPRPFPRPRPRSVLQGGNGLTGMRERAAAVGGYLEAAPRPGRGFAVRAWLPMEPAEEPDGETSRR